MNSLFFTLLFCTYLTDLKSKLNVLSIEKKFYCLHTVIKYLHFIKSNRVDFILYSCSTMPFITCHLYVYVLLYYYIMLVICIIEIILNIIFIFFKYNSKK